MSVNNSNDNSNKEIPVVKNQVLQEEDSVRIFHETVRGVAELIITPNIIPGPGSSTCIGDPFFLPEFPETEPDCKFIVGQDICVEFSVSFGAIPSTGQTGIIRVTPEMGSSDEQPPSGCTHTIGFYQNHPTETTDLINLAGGEIILGIENGGILQGLSIRVTPASADQVLSSQTPLPDGTPPNLINQYQQLYAQLLAAQLNVLSGASLCTAASDAISDANDFLASSPVAIDGAPAIQEVLASYNEGEIPGCPLHCDDEWKRSQQHH